MRAALVLLMVLAAPAGAQCIDYKQRPCRLAMKPVDADVVVSTQLIELRSTMLNVQFGGDGPSRDAWELEAATFDGVDLDARDHSLGDAIGAFGLRMTFLGFGYRIERPDFGARAFVNIGSVGATSMRYFTPELGLRFGDETRIELDLASTGLYAGSAECSNCNSEASRSLDRDFDLDIRASTRWSAGARLEARGRYRDIVTDEHHVRDAMIGAGVRWLYERGHYHASPMFVGIGARRELVRERADGMPETAARLQTPSSPQSPWEFLVWLHIDFGLAHRGL
jgi:hypothetical protein